MLCFALCQSIRHLPKLVVFTIFAGWPWPTWGCGSRSPPPSTLQLVTTTLRNRWGRMTEERPVQLVRFPNPLASQSQAGTLSKSNPLAIGSGFSSEAGKPV